MRIDWSRDGWRIFPDDADGTQPPKRYVKADLRLKGPVVLHLDTEEPFKGWVLVREYEVVT